MLSMIPAFQGPSAVAAAARSAGAPGNLPISIPLAPRSTSAHILRASSRNSIPPGKQDFQGMKVPTCQAQGRGANTIWATCHQFCATLSEPTKVGGLRDGCWVNRLLCQEVTHAQSLQHACNGCPNLTTCHGRNRPAMAGAKRLSFLVCVS